MRATRIITVKTADYWLYLRATGIIPVKTADYWLYLRATRIIPVKTADCPLAPAMTASTASASLSPSLQETEQTDRFISPNEYMFDE